MLYLMSQRGGKILPFEGVVIRYGARIGIETASGVLLASYEDPVSASEAWEQLQETIVNHIAGINEIHRFPKEATIECPE